MQKLNIQGQIERTEVKSGIQNLSTSLIDAANALSVIGLVFGSVIGYQLLFARPALPNVESASADEAVTHFQAAPDFAQ